MTAARVADGRPVAIEVHGLRRTFKGDVEAVRDIDLQVAEGEVFGFLGPNGAGKTTTVRVLCTLLPPTSGTSRVAGIDVFADPAGVRRRIGVALPGRQAGRLRSGGSTPRARRSF